MSKKPKLKMIRVEEKLHRYLKGEAYRRGLTVAELVEKVINGWIEKPKTKGVEKPDFSGMFW